MGRNNTVAECAIITYKGKEKQQSFSLIIHFVNISIKQMEYFCLDYKTN